MAPEQAISTAPDHPSILGVSGLTKDFVTSNGLLGGKHVVRAVDDVSFEVLKGETFGIVGESGSGKSTTARLLMHLLAKDSGRILFEGRQVGLDLSLQAFHRKVQMVFQDSYASLNPRLTIEDSIAFGPRVHGASRAAALGEARSLLEQVGLPPDEFGRRYPHELSGGQRQRANIARALAIKPSVVILDEAVSALDKSVEAQVLNLINHLKKELALTYIFISHDLHVVRYISDRVLVMYLGKVVEMGASEQLFSAPSHPYTRSLLDAIPSGDPENRVKDYPLTGDPLDHVGDAGRGCVFYSRCRFKEQSCKTIAPKASRDRSNGNLVWCHMYDPDSGHGRARDGRGA